MKNPLSVTAGIHKLGRPIVVYLVTALAVLLPLFGHGYILTLDMIFTPELRAPTKVDNNYLFQWLLHALNYVLPSMIIEKLLLFFILFAAGYGMHRLARYLLSQEASDSWWPAYGAGLFYMINPFTYTRFMVGQYLVLLGYSLLPFFVLSFVKLLQKATYKQALITGLLAALVTITSIHDLFPISVVAGIFFIVRLLQKQAGKRSLAIKCLLALFVWVALSGYWVVPTVLGSNATSHEIASFDERDIDAFATTADKHYGLDFNAASLHGFWADTSGRYELPKNHAPLWPLLTALIIGLSALGAYYGYRRRQPYLPALAVIGVIGWLLSMGTAGPTGLLYRWMLDYLPLFGGYREPQKFMALLALAYAPLLASGAQFIALHLRRVRLSPVVPVLLLALPFLYTPTMLWGFGGQLKPVNYPAEWYTLNASLRRDPGNYRILFLPWHQYLSFDFSSRVIASPAASFFDARVIQSDNPEIGGLNTAGATPLTAYVQAHIMAHPAQVRHAGRILSEIQVKYIVLAKTDQMAEYDFLNKQPDLQRSQLGSQLVVYKNLAYHR